MPRPSYDWQRIRDEYVMGGDDVTDTSMAARPGYPSRETINRRRRRDGWDAERSQYRHMVRTKSRDKATTHEAGIRARLAKAGEGMMAKGLRRIQAIPDTDLDVDQARRLADSGLATIKTAYSLGDQAEPVSQLTDEQLLEKLRVIRDAHE